MIQPSRILLILALGAPLCTPAESPAEVDLLDLAWRAAATIRLDQHDRTRAQVDILRDRLQSGEREGLDALIGQIDGWRRGEAWVLLGQAHLAAGDTAAAHAAAEAAEAIRAAASDWPAGRLGVELAQLWRSLGDPARASSEQALLTEREDKVADSLRFAHHQLDRGDWKAAFPALEAALWTYDVESAPALLAGWVRAADLAHAEDDAMQAARCRGEAARLVQAQPVDQLVRVLAQTRGLLGEERYTEWLAEVGVSLADAATAARTHPPHYSVPVIAAVVEDLAALGQHDAAATWLATAAELAATAEAWERPRLRARVARAAAALVGIQPTTAAALLELAAGDLAAVANPRPRALALVDQLRAWHQLATPVPPPIRAIWSSALADLEPRPVTFEVAR